MKYPQIALYILIGLIIGFILGRINLAATTDSLPLSCTYKGQTYAHGAGFSDDCNSCSCMNGQVSCTSIACASDIN